MSGVTILNTITTGRNWPLIILLFIYGLVFTVFTIVILFRMIECREFDVSIILCIFIAAMGFIFSDHYYNKPDTVTYKVTIDDSVSFNEFQERYRIIGQDGKIYTVEEKPQ